MRRQLKTDMRCWTHHTFKRIWKNHPPVTFLKSVEIIDVMHNEMLNHLHKTSRPIEFSKSLGGLELGKIRMRSPVNVVIDWNKTKLAGRSIKRAFHGRDNNLHYLKFNLARKFRLNMYKFYPLRRNKREVVNKIIKREIF